MKKKSSPPLQTSKPPSSARPLAIAVLASGGGSNLQALIDAGRAGQFRGAAIQWVISDQPGAYALERARHAGIEAWFHDPKRYSSRLAYDRALASHLVKHGIGLVCLAGYMRILSPAVVTKFPARILNIHPALLPAFGGRGMYGRHVHEAVIASGAKFSGCTVHFVDEGTDTGPIILQSVVPVLDHDTAETLAERVLIEEHRLYPRAVALFCGGKLQSEGRRVWVAEKA